MRVRHVGAGLLVLGLVGLRAMSGTSAAQPPTPAGTESPWVDVKDVKVEQIGSGRRLTIRLTRTPEYYNDWVIADPPRLIVDVGGPLASYPMPAEQFTVGDDLVSQVRVGSHGPNLRAVLDLTGDIGTHRRVRHDGPNIIVDLGDVPIGEASGSIPTVTAQTKSREETPPPPAPEPTVVASAPSAAVEPAPIARNGKTKPIDTPGAANPPSTLPEPTLARIGIEPDPSTATAPPPARESAAEAAPPPRRGGTGPLLVRDVRLETVGAGRRIRINLSRAPDGMRDFTLTGPPRLVIDLEGEPGSGAAASAKFALDDSLVQRVRVAPFEGKLRVVLDLQGDTSLHSVRQEGRSLIADLGQVSSNDVSSPQPMRVASVPKPSPKVDPRESFDTHTPPPLRGEEPLPPEPSVIAAASPPPAPIEVAKAAPAAAPVVDDVRPLLAVAQAAELPPSPAVAAAPMSDPISTPMPVQLARAEEPLPEPTRSPRLEREVMAVQSDEPPLPRQERVREDPPVQAEIPLPRPRRGKVEDTGRKAYRGQRISMDFKDADIQNVLRVLADVSGLNLIATDDVKGKVTLHLSDVPWDQALDLVLRSNRLDQTRDGNIVRISTVTRFKEERESLRAAQDAEKDVEPLKVRYVRVNYAHADEALVDKVKGVLTDRGSVTYDDRTNTVIVRDIAHGLNEAEGLLRELDVQSPQVLIEAHLVEATEDFARGLGVQWGYSYNAGPATGNPTGMNFPGTVGIGGASASGGRTSSGLPGVPGVPVPFLADFPVPSGFGSGDVGSSLGLLLGSLDGSQALAAKLTALEEAGKGKVISRPRVITLNNVAATIQSLTILRVKMPSSGTVINTGTGGVAGGSQSATEKINTGITLVVTPQISSDGFVLMNIYAKSSQPDFTRAVDGIPNEVSREANSNVLVKDNETVVLGGIYRQNTDDRESGIPYLRSVPGLGWLFKRNLKTTHHEELLVFLTPKIVATGQAQLPAATRLWEDRRRGS